MYIVIDRRDGFNICSRETLRKPFDTERKAQQLADMLNGAHPDKPYRVAKSESCEDRYIVLTLK